MFFFIIAAACSTFFFYRRLSPSSWSCPLVESLAASTLLEVLNTVAAVAAAVFVSNEADSDQIDAGPDQNRGFTDQKSPPPTRSPANTAVTCRE